MDDPLTYAFTDPAAVLFLAGVAAGCEERGSALALVPRLEEAAGARSALTTVRQPHREKGSAAVRLLAGGAPPEKVHLPIELVVRASTAPAP